MFRILSIALVTLALAYAAWANSASTLFSKFAPERGIRLDADSAQALMNITEKAGAKNDKTQFLKIARDNSVRALRSEPLSSRALRQLGVYYALRGNMEKARQLVEMSSSLSRRDTPGQLWLIDDYLRRGKSRDALQALDVVMRTQPQTREAAYGALGNALADPEFRKIFIPYVRSKPTWLKPFIQFNTGMKNPEILSRTLMQMRPLSKDIFDERTASALLVSLVNRAPIDDARTFYLSMPGASAAPLTSIEFARSADAFRFPPFGWEMLNDGNVQGFGNVKGHNVSIEALAVPGTSGTAARKLLFLRSGGYRWSGTADMSQMTGGSATANLLCNSGPGQWSRLGSVDLKPGRNRLAFVIGSSCAAQMLTINIVGADTQSDVSMRVSQMRLEPATGAVPSAAAPAKTVTATPDAG